MQQHGKRVLKPRRVDPPLAADERGDAVRHAQEMHRLVEQVRAEIVDRAAAGDDLVLPLRGVGGGLLRPVAVEVRLVLDDAAERVGFDELG